MKTITLEDGRKVEISNESYGNLAKSIRPEFKVGDWVIGLDGCHPTYPKRIRLFKSDNSVEFNGGSSNIIRCGDGVFVRLATPKEIEDHLTEEALTRGFKEGVVKRAYFPEYDLGGSIYNGKSTYTMNDCQPRYEADEDALRMGGGIIYHKGRWAEIVKDGKIKLSHEYSAEILSNGDVKVGCITIPFETIEKVYKAANLKKWEQQTEHLTGLKEL